MADEDTGDKAPLDFDSPELTWGDEPDPAPVDPPPTTPDESDTDAATSPDPAIPGSADGTDSSADRQPQGPIPFDRHKAILDKEREKRADLEAKWARHAWVEELTAAGKTPEQVRQALQVYDGVDADPVGFLERFYDQLKSHPTLGAPVRSWAGKMLASGRGQVPGAAPAPGEGDDPEPPPDYEYNGVPFYSAPQQAKHDAWRSRQQLAEFQQLLAPLQQEREQRQRAEAVTNQQQQEVERAKAELTDLRQSPLFVQHEGKVKTFLQAHPEYYRYGLHRAFLQVMLTEILPTLSQTERAAQLAELQTQAAAGSVSPRSAAVSSPRRPTDFDDPSLKW